MAQNDLLMRRVAGAFASLLRQSELSELVSAPEILFFLSKHFDQMYAKGALDLTPLYQEISNVPDAPPRAVKALFLSLVERQAQLGADLKLPPELAQLTPEQRADLRRAAVKRAAKGPVRKPRPAAPAAPDPTNPSRPVPSAAPRSWRRVWLGLGALAALGLALLVSTLLRPEPEIDTVPVVDIDPALMGLTGELRSKDSYFSLKVRRAEWLAIPTPQRAAGLEELRRACALQGMELLVVDDEEFQPLVVASPTGVTTFDTQ